MNSPSVNNIPGKMDEDNLTKLAKHTLALHKTLTKCSISYELHEEISSLIHKIMDVLLRTSCLDSTFKPPDLRKGVLEKITKGARRSNKISLSVNGASAIKHKIKSCRVILHKIPQEDVKKYLCPGSVTEELLPANTVIPQKMARTERRIASRDIGPDFSATEQYLDLLMAKEMKTSLSIIEQRLNQTPLSNNSKPKNISPVVMLKKLSPQFITQALKLRKSPETPEIASKLKAKVASKMIRKSYTGVRRRSERSSVIKPSCQCCPDETVFLDQKMNENEENHPGHSRNKFKRKGDYSDDEEFFGFESPEKNKRRANKVKKTLQKLSAKTMGKENENIERKFGCKNYMRQKTPLKAVNRIDRNSWVSENLSIFKDQRSQDETVLSGIDFNANGRDFGKEVFLNQNNSGDNGVNDDKLRLLKLYKQKADMNSLMNRLTLNEGKVLKSNKSSDDNSSTNSFNLYSNEFHLKKTGRRIPLWAEENVRKLIMLSQDEIPTEIIDDYFYRPQALSLSSLFSSTTCS